MKTQDIFIAHPRTSEHVSALKAFMQALKIKFEVSKSHDKPYNQEFVDDVLQGKKDIENGRYTDVKLENLKDFIADL